MLKGKYLVHVKDDEEADCLLDNNNVSDVYVKMNSLPRYLLQGNRPLINCFNRIMGYDKLRMVLQPKPLGRC